MKLIKLIILIILNTIYFITTPVIKTFSDSKDTSGKEVVILGDKHFFVNLLLPEKEDKEQETVILNWLTDNLSKITDKLVFFLESTTEAIQAEAYPGLILNLKKILLSNKLAVNNIEFIFCDVRNKYTNRLVAVSLALTLDLKALVKIVVEPNCLKNTKDKFKGASKDSQIKCIDFINFTNKILKTFNKQITTLAIPNSAKKFLETLYSNAESNFDYIQNCFNGFDLNLYTTDTIIDYFAYCLATLQTKEPKIFKTKFYELYTMQLYDLSLIINFSKKLPELNKFIFLHGATHNTSLESFLKYLGFEQKVNKVSQEYFDKKELSDLLNNTFNLNHLDLSSSINKAVKTKIIHNCASCNKENATQRCSRCKKIYYCTQDCQKADWVSHKANCKSV